MTYNRSRASVSLITLCVVIFVAASVCAAYDRLAALRYARDYWDKVCSDGYFFEDSEWPSLLGAGKPVPTNEEGFDCAHFVSCCIGSEPNEPAGGLKVPSRTLTYGEPGAQRLVNWLLGQGATRVKSISALVPGDVVAYDADHDNWIEHVSLYMGDGLVTAHSISRYTGWNPDPTSDFVFVHLPGPYEPPQTEGMLNWMGWLVTLMMLAGAAAAIFVFGQR